MLFNTPAFAFFFGVVFLVYQISNHRWQNRLLLGASYVFYGAWDWRFLSLILFSTLLDYFCGLGIDSTGNQRTRRMYLLLSVVGNLSVLGFFKYFHFFSDTFRALSESVGLEAHPVSLSIILPLGISFYTFQTMSYTIDIYRGVMKPTTRFLDFALFVSFFPQLVAGPIERAHRLLPQLATPRTRRLDQFYEGAFLIFWGLFLKIFVADNLAPIVDSVFAGEAPYRGTQIIVASYAFAFQIFGDFAGYSNMARGLAKCLGFELMVNFRVPYLAGNPREFWRRWHISLSTWLRDYLYISFGGGRGSTWKTYRNLGVTMVLGGLWHGAAWTFVLWGAYHGGLLVVHRAATPLLVGLSGAWTGLRRRIWDGVCVVVFFHLVCLGWLIFRAESLMQVVEMVWALFFNFQLYGSELRTLVPDVIFYTWLLVMVQVAQHWKKDLLVIFRMPYGFRAAFYVVCFYLMLIYGVTGGKEFIYFQF